MFGRQRLPGLFQSQQRLEGDQRILRDIGAILGPPPLRTETGQLLLAFAILRMLATQPVDDVQCTLPRQSRRRFDLARY